MLQSAARLLSRRFKERTRDSDLTSAQWRRLVFLCRQGAMRQARLAEALDIEPISVSRMIDRMAGAGWVERQPDPQDRRARLIQPTPRAKAALSSLSEVADAVYDEALRGFSSDDVARLMDLMTRTAGLAAAPTGTKARRGACRA